MQIYIRKVVNLIFKAISIHIRNLFTNINLRNFISPLAGVITIGLFFLFKYFPDLAYSIYLKGIFQVLRILHDYTFGLLPLGTVYLLFGILCLGILYYLFGLFNENNGWSIVVKLSWDFLMAVILVVSLFYLLWGYNYAIPNDQVAYVASEVDLNEDYIITEVRSVQTKIANLRIHLVENDSMALDSDFYNSSIEDEIRVSQEEILKSWHWPIYGRVRIRHLVPEGILLRLSTAGVYIPFALEGHIDAGLFHLQYPFTMAHEMAHGYGFTDEGFCNFVGFVTCVNTENEYIQYSAWLNYWRYLMNDLRKINKEIFYCQIQDLPIAITKDLDAIHDYQDRFPDIMPVARDVIYDAYLKSNGVKKGLVSYSEMTKMIYLWKSQNSESELVKQSF